MKMFLVAGARPNFMKIAPIFRESLKYADLKCMIIHTGQHYDYEMSQAFFDDLGLPAPDYFLNVGSGSHAHQTAAVMTSFEALCEKETPDLVVVVGDVNSTLACSITAKKLLIKVAHIEAGLRSFDMSMPEEINRMVTDAISDYYFVTEESGMENLLKEGKPQDRIYFVGHVMIDNLFHQLKALKDMNIRELKTFAVKEKYPGYAFLTMHRPSNVDSKECFKDIAEALNTIAQHLPIVFPVHPRTNKMMKEHGIMLSDQIVQLPPLAFKESLYLWKDAAIVITDSGGLQEETTALKVRCLTLRENTERPITVQIGSNMLGGTKKESILSAYERCMQAKADSFRVPPKWDGKASSRIFDILMGPTAIFQNTASQIVA